MLDLPTAEDVADLLREHGVKGKKRAGVGELLVCVCPLAVFASGVAGRPFAVGPARMIDETAEPRTPGHTTGTPRAASEFMARFDAGDPAFADLVAS